MQLRPLMIALAASVIALAPAFGADGPKTRILLPKGITPLHYDVLVTPDAAALKFAGEVTIDMQVENSTDTVTLNALELSFDAVALDGAKAEPKINFDAGKQTASLTFPAKLTTGKHSLYIKYRGKVETNSAGLFSADYKTEAGQKRMLVTQFEPSDARRFLPCFDEPGLKASFTVSTIIPQADTAISNMPVETSEPAGAGLVKVKFKPTPKMSSYLLFYGVGDFERRSRMVDGVDVGVVTKRGDLDRADFALDAAVKILPYYNEYFGTPFPLPKLDLIAVPSAGGFGAMENWGAVLYFEPVMLLDPKFSTERARQSVFSVIAHETAHQWFGNLVTMSWWDDLWLNEGFASWMENKAQEQFHPEWHAWVQSEDSKQEALRLDSNPTHHPIVQPVYSAVDATQAFDGITYLKGQAVIRMLEGHAGPDVFRDGVRRYMKKHAFGNTITKDLWAEIEAAGGKNVIGIANDFTLQPGVPLVSVTNVTFTNNTSTMDVKLGRFELNPIPSKVPTWSVPITAKVIGDFPSTKTIARGNTKLSLKGCGPVLINAGQTSYLVPTYAPKAFEALVSAFPKLSLDDQMGVFADARLVGSAGLQPITDALDIIQVMPVESDPLIWSQALGSLRNFDVNYNEDAKRQEQFRAFARRVAEPLFARIGWTAVPGESDNTISLRQDLIWTLGKFGSPDVLGEVRKRFEAFAADRSTLPAGLRQSVLRVMAYHADAATFERMFKMAEESKSELERSQMFGVLALVKDPNVAALARDLFISPRVPDSMTPRLLAGMSGLYPADTFAFAKSHWDLIKGRLDSLQGLEYMPSLVSGSHDPALVEDMKAFVKSNLPPEAARGAAKAEDNVKFNVKFRAEQLPKINKWLDRVGN